MLKRSEIFIAVFMFGVFLSISAQSQNSTMKGNDGKTYRTIKIGDQWWMAENLRETKYRNGDIIPNITNNSEWREFSIGALCAYGNSEINVSTYGYLYNWFTINDSRNIAPPGWHVPTDKDWTQLEMHLGVCEEEIGSLEERETYIGGKLKESGTIHWDPPNTGATNESGFSALPGGFRGSNDHGDLAVFYALNEISAFWTATESDSGGAWFRQLNFDNSEFWSYRYGKNDGFSIRLIKN